MKYAIQLIRHATPELVILTRNVDGELETVKEEAKALLREVPLPTPKPDMVVVRQAHDAKEVFRWAIEDAD
jgi:hypothetical protein